MPYQYDIFISYKRDAETNNWLQEHLEPLLMTYVGLELGRAPVMFRDDQIEAGTTWPITLGAKLACSRVLIALYTKTYFHSKWCTKELALMLQREKQAGYRNHKYPDGLIIPAVLHDCEQLPKPLAGIQARPIRECFNVRMQKNSSLAERLAGEIAELAKPIARAINSAPKWRGDWTAANAAQFQKLIHAKGASKQNTVPGFGS